MRLESAMRLAWLVLCVGVSGCVTTDPGGDGGSRTEVETAVDQPEHGLAHQVWGLGPSDTMPELDTRAVSLLRGTDTQDPESPSPGKVLQDPSEEAKAMLRARFGSSILIAPDGTVTKQYYLNGEGGRVFLNLLVPDPSQGLPAGPVRIGGGSNNGSILSQRCSTSRTSRRPRPFLFVRRPVSRLGGADNLPRVWRVLRPASCW